MALDKVSEQKICAWLSSRGQLVCPLCQGKAWGIGDMVGFTVVPTPITGTGINLLGSPVALHVPLTCINCAYTVFFSAAQVGLLPPPPATAANPPTPAPAENPSG